MKITWESGDWPGARIEPAITHLAWVAQADRPGHGLLGVGSDSGSVGITLTDLYPTDDDNGRYNFNLRGHHSAICMVTWNRVQTKLASCDSSGVIYVWVRNDDRWSVELVNDRGVKVRDLSWSPCGSSALICYEDNFVLIGSSTGQRIWSNSFPTTTTVTAGVWAPDSRQLVLGFASGNIQVLSDQGANITERSFTTDPIVKLACSHTNSKEDRWILAILTSASKILMISAFDQIDPLVYGSSYSVVQMQWNSDGSILALINTNHELVMLDREARVIHKETLALPKDKPLSALTWAHEGRVVIVAAGGHLAIGKLLLGVPFLFDLVTYELWRYLGSESKKVDSLPIPVKEKNALRSLDHHIIRCRIPRIDNLCSFVCSASEARCYCTIKPLSRGSHSYVLCMEHLGGLVPLLVGRQVNRFLPQFHISLHPSDGQVLSAGSSAQVEDLSIIPRTSNGRNSLWRRSKRQLRALMSRHVRPPRPDLRLVQVSSNVWCTRFSITSMSPRHLPDFLGQVVYKTSVLHLQPRQMTIDMAVLGGLQDRSASNGHTVSSCTSPATSEVEVDDFAALVSQQRFRDDDGLTHEERAFFDRVVSECTSLRAAMDAGGLGTSLSQGTSQVAASKDESSPARAESRLDDTEQTMSTTSTWHDEIDSLEYIDGVDDRDPLIPGTSSAVTSVSSAPNTSTATKTGQQRDSDDIKAHLDKLARIAGQLSHRHADFNPKRDRASINKMRSQMKELLRRVNEIEKKVGSGDVRGEVRQLMRTLEEMKCALGEGSAPKSTAATPILTMHNKTPFWNEHNQVYQLDFGGRVTQESAKNFQVEMDGKQVLQFGRIEGGAYTLDFRRPFSATQAFAVALASITQRLK
ncbi:Tub domain-containing protein [Trichostrongylus colubriformis]|uniref:Tub domain-containing protein n=2 Tax=Trichostrongylus colubriformis TaxID=6319 RepID=A0AAN8ES19_TRICO